MTALLAAVVLGFVAIVPAILAEDPGDREAAIASGRSRR